MEMTNETVGHEGEGVGRGADRIAMLSQLEKCIPIGFQHTKALAEEFGQKYPHDEAMMAAFLRRTDMVWGPNNPELKEAWREGERKGVERAAEEKPYTIKKRRLVLELKAEPAEAASFKKPGIQSVDESAEPAQPEGPEAASEPEAKPGTAIAVVPPTALVPKPLEGELILPWVAAAAGAVEALNQKHSVIGNYGSKCVVLSWERWNIDPKVFVPTFQTSRTSRSAT
jgi:hypothetical protein